VVPGAHVDAEGRAHPVRADGTAVVLHRPGVVHFVVAAPAATAAQLDATLAAGRWTDVDVALADAPAPASAPAPPRREEKRATPFELPLGAGLGGLGLVGLGSFALFGLRSQSTYDDLLARCAPRCEGSDRDAAVRADREQTIANVSLVVGAVAIVVGGALVVHALAR